MGNYRGYIGTYTKGESEGLYSFSLDTDKGEIRDVRLAAVLDNPTYLTISDDNQNLYSVIKKGETGGAVAFSIDQNTGALKALNDRSSNGAAPCHISVDQKKQYVLTANYHKAEVVLYPLNPEDGRLKDPSSIVKLEGSGPNPKRQESAHTHFAGWTPDEKYVVIVDLGMDAIVTYQVKAGKLEEASRLLVKPGCGPRHIAFHPNEKYAYVMTELSGEIIVLDYDAETGKLLPKQYAQTLPTHFSGYNDGSAIHLTTDGRFVYCANRGHNSIAAFRVDEGSGQLTLIEHTPTEGDWPRDFVLDPSERFLVAANQNSGNLVLFSRDVESGRLTLRQEDVRVPDPVCVKFLHI